MTKTALPADDSNIRARLLRALGAPLKGLKDQVFGRFFNRLLHGDKLSPTWPYPPGSYTLVDNGFTMTRRYHIRQLTSAGPMFGGGIDTPTLCEKFDASWFDKPQPVTQFALGECCQECAMIYRASVE